MNLVDTILQSMRQLPPFSAVIQRVIQLMGDPRSSAQDIVEVIQYDQSITANILKVCNSAYFGSNRPISSAQEAVVRIGFDQLLDIILGQESGYLFSQAYQGYDLETGELWRHSVACALLSQIISGRLKMEKKPIHFTAALLHDIGKVILNEFVREHFKDIKKLAWGKDLSFIEVEKEVLGIDHAELGGKISEQWQFPKVIVSAIRYHHNPLAASQDREAVNLIYLCNLVTLLTGIGGGADGLSYHAYEEMMKQYQLSGKDIEQFISQLVEQFKKVEGMLTLKQSV